MTPDQQAALHVPEDSQQLPQATQEQQLESQFADHLELDAGHVPSEIITSHNQEETSESAEAGL
jgi:hypothetical protein